MVSGQSGSSNGGPTGPPSWRAAIRRPGAGLYFMQCRLANYLLPDGRGLPHSPPKTYGAALALMGLWNKRDRQALTDETE